MTRTRNCQDNHDTMENNIEQMLVSKLNHQTRAKPTLELQSKQCQKPNILRLTYISLWEGTFCASFELLFDLCFDFLSRFLLLKNNQSLSLAKGHQTKHYFQIRKEQRIYSSRELWPQQDFSFLLMCWISLSEGNLYLFTYIHSNKKKQLVNEIKKRLLPA